ncbi:MAG: acetate--CoA ligase family protein [Pseudomonadota bacterium]
METILSGFISPASIAVVGASHDTGKPGGKIVENILSRGYRGELFPVNPKSALIQGLPAVSSIGSLPYAPDLVYIAIPAQFVADAFLELAKLGVTRVIVLSSGFGEKDEAGGREEARLVEIAGQYGMTFLGPNCLGVMSPVHAGKFAGLLPGMRAGGIDFISGSGATVDILAEQAVRRGLTFNTFITVGNSAQMGVTDVLALIDQAYGPHSSKHMMLYMEKVGSPPKFFRHARSLTQKGCVIMAVKSGVTDGGRRAAASHTGAMAASDTAVQALFDKAGLIRFTGKLDMVDAATALILARGNYDGRRACVITDAGGPGVMTCDELNRQGIGTPCLKPETRRKLAELLPPGAGLNNPIDMTATRSPEQVARILEIIAADEADTIDYILIHLGDPGFEDNWPVYRAVMEAMDTLSTPVFPAFCTSISSAEALSRYRAAGKCHFEDEVSMARAVGRMVNRPRLSVPSPDPDGYDGKAAALVLEGVSGIVPPDLARKVLQAAGIPVPGEQILETPDDLACLAQTLSQPWVMKVLGPLHKSEFGGVETGVTLARAGETFDRLMTIPGARGVLAQETVQGPEVILGLSREKDFGHLVAFGLGGVLTEILGQVRFGLAPLTLEEAGRMVRSVPGLPALQGYRNLPGMDLDRLASLLVRVSLLGRDIPRIREMDINPLKGVKDSLAAVDVRIIMDQDLQTRATGYTPETGSAGVPCRQ